MFLVLVKMDEVRAFPIVRMAEKEREMRGEKLEFILAVKVVA